MGGGFSGHSGRIGMARRMVAAGAPNAAVQRQGRWKHGDMVTWYTRGESAGEALKLFNVNYLSRLIVIDHVLIQTPLAIFPSGSGIA